MRRNRSGRRRCFAGLAASPLLRLRLGIAGHILMDKLFLEGAEEGHKRPAASRAVDRIGIGKPGMFAFEIAKLHSDSLPHK